MFLQILPPNAFENQSESILDNQLLLVILGLSLSVFAIIKIAKILSKIKISKTAENASFTA